VEFQFAAVLVFLVVGVGLAAFTLGLSKLLRPFKPSAEKDTIYECGELPIGSPWIRFNMRFYVVALIFVVFDVETVLLYPWATVYRDLGGISFVYLLIFLIALILALAYVWKKGDLEWVRPQVHRQEVNGPVPRHTAMTPRTPRPAARAVEAPAAGAAASGSAPAASGGVS
jgi:NADH-quinone oxidoreductase subunit A